MPNPKSSPSFDDAEHDHPTDDDSGRLIKAASNRLFWQPGEPFVYPYEIDLSVDDGTWTVHIGEGVTFSTAGADVSADEALTSWRAHFVKAEGEWLVPYLRRIAAGETVRMRDLIDEFERRHGREPVVYL